MGLKIVVTIPTYTGPCFKGIQFSDRLISKSEDKPEQNETF